MECSSSYHTSTSVLHSPTTAITISCLYHFKNGSTCVESEWSVYLVWYWYVSACKCPLSLVLQYHTMGLNCFSHLTSKTGIVPDSFSFTTCSCSKVYPTWRARKTVKACSQLESTHSRTARSSYLVMVWTYNVYWCCLGFCSFFMATVSVDSEIRKIHFTLNYWAFIFPNVGLTIALIQAGNALDSAGVCSAMSDLAGR